MAANSPPRRRFFYLADDAERGVRLDMNSRERVLRKVQEVLGA
jgi:hypothetical protein